MGASTLTIGVLAPEVLGTYGDGGNALVLARRAQMRDIDAEIVPIGLDEAIPSSLDIYTLGGGEDTAQILAAEHIRSGSGFASAVESNRVVLAICASLQILGNWYLDAQGRKVNGLGILDIETTAGQKRMIGELVTEPLVPGLTEKLTGFENHGGATSLGQDVHPLGKVLSGFGNGDGGGHGKTQEETPGQLYDGVWQGNIIATYMHGPVLARNPQLADWLLEKALGYQLEPLDLPSVDQLRHQRLQAVLGMKND